jgi:NitT/TauT family transport system substrate-binding protein
MKPKMRIMILWGIVSYFLWLVACTPPSKLKVGIHPWVGYESLYIARELKWLPDRVQLHDGNSVADSLAALRSGEAAAACLTLDEMLRARADGLPLSAALVFDVSAGADVVLARPEIRTLSDLAHKRIGFDPATLGALVFEKLLQAAELTASEVVQLNIAPDKQLDAWRNNEVDVVITYEPNATAIHRAGAHQLFDSRQMPDVIIDVLAVRRDRPDVLPLIRNLIATHFRALDYMRTHEQDFLLRIAAREGVTPEESRRMLAGVSLPSLAANRSYLAGGHSRLLRAAGELSTLMVRRGLLAKEDDLDQLTLLAGLPSEEP